MKKKNFTLIELLIVVAIIAILAAILFPSLQKAKYLARLAVCTSDLRQQGLGLTMWADDNDGKWAERTVYSSGNRQPNLLKSGSSDDRELFDKMLGGLQFTNCTFIGEPPYDIATVGGTFVLSGYEYWVGGAIDDSQPNSNLKRITDTMVWTSGTTNYEFDILVADTDRRRNASKSIELSHPDSLGLAPLQLIDVGYKIYMYFSWDGLRGTVDRNFLHTDGSVNRIMKIEGATNSSWDSRLVRVPYKSSRTDTSYGFLPTSN